MLVTTLILGGLFVGLQFFGFTQIIELGYYFTGSESSVTTSFLYVIAFAHIAHVFAGIVVLLTVIYNHFKQRYYPGQTLELNWVLCFGIFLIFSGFT